MNCAKVLTQTVTLLLKINYRTQYSKISAKLHISFVIYSLFLKKKKKETDAMTAIHHIKYVLECNIQSLGMVKPFYKKNTLNTQWQCVNGFVCDAIDLVWFIQ